MAEFPDFAGYGLICEIAGCIGRHLESGFSSPTGNIIGGGDRNECYDFNVERLSARRCSGRGRGEQHHMVGLVVIAVGGPIFWAGASAVVVQGDALIPVWAEALLPSGLPVLLYSLFSRPYGKIPERAPSSGHFRFLRQPPHLAHPCAIPARL